METEQYAVHPEIAKEIPQAAPEEQVQEQQVQEVQQEQTADNLSTNETPKEVESKNAKNFRELKAQRDRIERERDELVKLLKQQSQRQEVQDDEPPIDPNALLEGKDLKRYDKKFNKLENQLKESQQKLTIQATKYQLKNDFPDFDKVVNDNNISRFKEEYPELAKTLDATTDLYTMGASAYTLFKKFGIYVEDNYEKDRYKVQENMNKPKPVSSISTQQGSSPLAKANAFANGLTDELRKQLIKEMAEARKSI